MPPTQAYRGHPDYTLPLLGVWKIAGAAVILVPRLARLKEGAYAGMLFDASAAAVCRTVLSGDPFAIVLPLRISGIVLASWVLRLSERILEAV